MNLSARLRRVDVLVVVVAVLAVVLRNDHEVAEVYEPGWGSFLVPRLPRSTISIVGTILRVHSDLMAGLIAMTVGLGLAALRRPWLPGRGRWPGRGMAAIAVGSLGVVKGSIDVALKTIQKPPATTSSRFDPHFLSDLLQSCHFTPANAIVGAWTLLVLAGRWRSSEAGFGRLGRVLGWCWLASILFDLCRAALI